MIPLIHSTPTIESMPICANGRSTSISAMSTNSASARLRISSRRIRSTLPGAPPRPSSGCGSHGAAPAASGRGAVTGSIVGSVAGAGGAPATDDSRSSRSSKPANSPTLG
ncbi:putative polyketide synthase [Burkholderia pseudomallei MSHR435]|nr:putative polyketide synthase [Burkholderia pseudomallei MSHR435]